MKYVSIDVETTGLDPETCDIVEVAAVLEDTADARPVEELPALRLVLTSGRAGDGTFRGTPEALGMHGRLWAEIADWRERGRPPVVKMPADSPHLDLIVPPDRAACLLRAFLDTWGAAGWDDCPAVLAGKNLGTFDLRFLRRLPGWEHLRHRHRILDPGGMYARPDDEAPPDLAECCRRAGIPAPAGHEALADARCVVRLIRRHWGLTDLPNPVARVVRDAMDVLTELDAEAPTPGRGLRPRPLAPGERVGSGVVIQAERVGDRETARLGPPIGGPALEIRGLQGAELGARVGAAPEQIRQGDLLEVLRDDGTREERRVEHAPWQLGDGTWVVGLDGIAGGYALERCRWLGQPG